MVNVVIKNKIFVKNYFFYFYDRVIGCVFGKMLVFNGSVCYF